MDMACLTLWVYLLSIFTRAWTHGRARGGRLPEDLPFITVWNAPSQECQEKYNVSLNLEVFDVVVNQNESFMGKDMTLFYSNRIGYYPYYAKDGTAVYGGAPQNASLEDHLCKAQQDIKETILESSFRGLAVIDWERWRPLWIRNWGSMAIYKNKSVALVKGLHPDWPADKVAQEAQREFEQSGQAFMEQTLVLGKTLRPGGFWGYYGFPNCYNYDNEQGHYTGECPDIEKQRNEELQWLWNQSQALYPSIYLPKEIRLLNKSLEFVRHRVQEAFRMVDRTRNGSIPVLPYASIIYEHTQLDFLSQEDLAHTIGESASQGAAGIILWGSDNYSCSQEACLHVKKYVDTLLGHYIVNVTSSTRLCSQVVCFGHGRCTRQGSHPEASLHLSPTSFSIKRHPAKPHFIVTGHMSKEEQVKMAEEFKCQCYGGWEGPRCNKKSYWNQ